MDFRVGFGYDVHQLAEGRRLMIGGVHIPHHSGSMGHSDGDVLIHAICDALLGAANLRDIGFHFSDQDAAYKDIDSKLLLEYVVAMLADKGFAIGNIDATVALQKPRLSEVYSTDARGTCHGSQYFSRQNLHQSLNYRANGLRGARRRAKRLCGGACF